MIIKKSTKEILEINLQRGISKGMKNLKVMLHNIRSLHNTGSAFRSCDAFGAGELILSGYTPAPPRPEISKTALGADESVPWSACEEPVSILQNCKKQGYQIIGIEQTKDSVLLPEFTPAPTDKILLIFGNEVTGIDEDLIPHLDFCLEIPQFGQKHSLNISVSLGVVLYHFMERFTV